VRVSTSLLVACEPALPAKCGLALAPFAAPLVALAIE
jgi:hypothetical protein